MIVRVMLYLIVINDVDELFGIMLMVVYIDVMWKDFWMMWDKVDYNNVW